jgi:hypothetical protein
MGDACSKHKGDKKYVLTLKDTGVNVRTVLK